MLSKEDVLRGKNKYLRETYFNKLTDFIPVYEQEIFDRYSKIPNKTDFSKNLTILSPKSCYRTCGVLGLSYLINKTHKIPTYNYVSLQSAFAYNFQSENYDAYMWEDVLIISGNYKGFKKDTIPYIDEVIAEIIMVRRDANKLTWLFLEDLTLSELKNSMPNTLKAAPLEKCLTLGG